MFESIASRRDLPYRSLGELKQGEVYNIQTLCSIHEALMTSYKHDCTTLLFLVLKNGWCILWASWHAVEALSSTKSLKHQPIQVLSHCIWIRVFHYVAGAVFPALPAAVCDSFFRTGRFGSPQPGMLHRPSSQGYCAVDGISAPRTLYQVTCRLEHPEKAHGIMQACKVRPPVSAHTPEHSPTFCSSWLSQSQMLCIYSGRICDVFVTRR